MNMMMISMWSILAFDESKFDLDPPKKNLIQTHKVFFFFKIHLFAFGHMDQFMPPSIFRHIIKSIHSSSVPNEMGGQGHFKLKKKKSPKNKRKWVTKFCFKFIVDAEFFHLFWNGLVEKLIWCFLCLVSTSKKKKIYPKKKKNTKAKLWPYFTKKKIKNLNIIPFIVCLGWFYFILSQPLKFFGIENRLPSLG